MSKLRDLLNAAKQEGSNGKNEQSVLQPKTEPKNEPAATSPTQGEIANEIGEQEDPNRFAPNEHTIGNSVVEQGPPSGLSFLQRKQWEKNNVKHVASTSGTNSVNGAGGHSSGAATVSTVETNVAKPSALVVQSSATKLEVVPETQVAEKSAGDNAPDGKVDVEVLRMNLTYLANNIEQPELVGQVVRTIAIQLKQMPELVPFMKDADFDLIVRGARSAYKVAARKKSEAREKKAAGKKDTTELNQAFKDAGLDELMGTLKLS